MDANNWVDQSLDALNPAWEPNVSAALVTLRQRQKRLSLPPQWAWALTGATALALCLLALPSARAIAHRCLECSVAVWQTLSPSSSPTQSPLTPAASRPLAPDFSLLDASGHPLSLSSLRGHVILLNFWATWCHGCQIEIPWLVEFQKKYGSQGLTVVGVSMDDDGWKSVKPWLREKGINYPIVIGNAQLGGRYRLLGMPLTVLIDRTGKIADVRNGMIGRIATKKKLDELLAESAGKS